MISIVGLLAIAGITHSHAREEGNNETPEVRKLRIALQEKYAKLPVVKPETRLGNVSYTMIDLSGTPTKVEDENYYAFRFVTPKEEGNLVWSFRPEKGLLQWYIVPEKDRMFGFHTFSRRHLTQDVENVGGKRRAFHPADPGQTRTQAGKRLHHMVQIRRGCRSSCHILAQHTLSRDLQIL